MSKELNQLIEKSIAPAIQQKENKLNVAASRENLKLLESDYQKYLKQELEKASATQKHVIQANLDLHNNKNSLNDEKTKIESINKYLKGYLLSKCVAESSKIDAILREIKSLAELKNALKNGGSLYKCIKNKPESLLFLNKLVEVCELNQDILNFLMTEEKKSLTSDLNKREKIIDKQHTLEILTRAANKVVSSIFRPDSMGAFSQEMLEALASGDSGCIFASYQSEISNQTKIADQIKGEKRPLHAEMNIIQNLYERSVRDFRKLQPKPIYIGLNKFCCANCDHTISQLNSKYQDLIGQDIAENKDKNNTLFKTRGAHLNQYHWPIPPFVIELGLDVLVGVNQKVEKSKKGKSRMKEEIVCSDSEPEVKLNFDSFDKNSIQDIKSVSSISNLISSENLSASKKSCEKEFY